MPSSNRTLINSMGPRVCRRLSGAALLLGTAGVAGFYLCGFSIDRITALVPLRCPLKLVTGLSCPTCGLGHGLVAAATGHWAEAWSYHPLALPFLLALLLSGVGLSFFPTRLQQSVHSASAWLKQHPRCLSFGVAAYLVWGLIRWV